MPNRAKQHRTRNVAGRSQPSGMIRPSSHARGYGRPWQRLRIDVLDAEPLCRPCTKAGKLNVLATEVDHIVPTRGVNDPRHYDQSNLQPLCKSCHSRKTVADTARGATRQFIGDV